MKNYFKFIVFSNLNTKYVVFKNLGHATNRKILVLYFGHWQFAVKNAKNNVVALCRCIMNAMYVNPLLHGKKERSDEAEIEIIGNENKKNFCQLF